MLSSLDSAFALNRQFTPSSLHASGIPYNDGVSTIGTDVGEASYSRADRVTYRYYLGRLRLSQHRIRLVRAPVALP